MKTALLFFLIGLAAIGQPFSLQPPGLRVAPEPDPEDDPPPVYELQWDVATNAATLKGFDLYTNGVHYLQTNANVRSVTIWPVGQWITNDVRAYSLPVIGGLPNYIGSTPSVLVWSNIFWQKPVTNIVTIVPMMTPTRPVDLTVGNQVPNWGPITLTNPATPGVNLFWIPLTKTTNPQPIQCRTGAITNNLFLDGRTFTNWPPFIGQGFYWVRLISTNI